ncbi:TPA: hypothetical protein DCR49_11190 [Candidatus Delongbacteria bacterium]|nr:hypothetical protein [Candidatus Delongbacteria bacterium]
MKLLSKFKNISKLMISSLILMSMLSCAYYNMYFNARESYNEAEKKRKETNMKDKALYDNSLKELSKILEFYPESKWVDDALLMMGLCYLRQEEYDKAKRKFNELITNYPGTDLTDKAKLHMAEVEIALKNYDEARILMEGIRTEDIEIEQHELLKLNAEMNLSMGDSLTALELYVKASESAKGPAVTLSLLETASLLAEKLGSYEISAELYRKLFELYIEREKKFKAMVKYAESLDKMNKNAEAVSLLEELTANEEYAQYSLAGDVKLAGFYLAKKDTVKSYEKLDEILRTNPKDKNNGAALSETAYYFGEYYFNLKKDFNSAENMYDSSGYYDRQNIFFQKASDKINLIRNYRNLRRKTEAFLIQKDSLESKISRLEVKRKLKDESDEGYKSLSKDFDQAQKQLKTLISSNVADKMTYAELLYYELDMKDTAKVLFKEVSKETMFPHKASKAMLSLILSDSVQYTGYEDSLLYNYPNTTGANYIRLKRGIEPVNVIEDSAKYFFNISSQKFIDSLYAEAMNEYIEIGTKYEKSPVSPKVLQAAGMIAENYLKDYGKAAEIYGILKEKHPGSASGKFAALKLRADGEKADKTQKVQEKIPETEKWYQMDRRNN